MEMNPFNLRVPKGADTDESLRALEWSALLARLGAERDLRREFAADRGASRTAADFMNGAARIAGDSSQDAQSVNPETLADRKSAGHITAAAGGKTRAAEKSVRGKQ
ncbi:MAG: hypothetical protein Q8R44_17725 [Novosphingobium sp.]|nr:hypothetical protein [Novosphingobium sp.]